MALKIVSDQLGTRYLVSAGGFTFQVGIEELVEKGYFEVANEYPFLKGEPDDMIKMLTEMLDDVVKEPSKWFLITDSEGKHVGVLCNANEYMRLREREKYYG